MSEDKIYHYAFIEEILQGKYTEKNVRIAGCLADQDPVHSKFTLMHGDSSIDCLYTDSNKPQITGDFLQVCGYVRRMVPQPIILLHFCRNINGVNEDDYDFAISKFKQFVHD